MNCGDILINKKIEIGTRSSYLKHIPKKTSNASAYSEDTDDLDSVFESQDNKQPIKEIDNNFGKNYSYALKMMAEMDNYNIRERQRRSMEHETETARNQNGDYNL